MMLYFQNSKGELHSVVGDDRTRSFSQRQISPDSDRDRLRSYTNEARKNYNACRLEMF
jgi:hypothetical protein